MQTNLVVDRSELADTAQPDKLAELVIAQLVPQLPTLLPLPINEVAAACGILDIKPLDTDEFEGGLIQDVNKERGFILLRVGAFGPRSRFTVAHELGHFVNLRHVAPVGSKRLLCSKDDLRTFGSVGGGRHGMEAQANEFAACLLMPRQQIGAHSFMVGSPEVARILALQQLCEVSKEAAARRYAQLHGGDFAIVFTKDGKLAGYPIRGGTFPWLDLKPGQAVYWETATKTFAGREGDSSDQEETEASWWLAEGDAERWTLWEEVLVQQSGYRMTLLVGDPAFKSHGEHERNWTPGFH